MVVQREAGTFLQHEDAERHLPRLTHLNIANSGRWGQLLANVGSYAEVGCLHVLKLCEENVGKLGGHGRKVPPLSSEHLEIDCILDESDTSQFEDDIAM